MFKKGVYGFPVNFFFMTRLLFLGERLERIFYCLLKDWTWI